MLGLVTSYNNRVKANETSRWQSTTKGYAVDSLESTSTYTYKRESDFLRASDSPDSI